MEFSFSIIGNCKNVLADYTMKKSCGIYEMENEKGRHFYKFFASNEDLQLYLKKNKDKIRKYMKPVFIVEEYKECANTKIVL